MTAGGRGRLECTILEYLLWDGIENGIEDGGTRERVGGFFIFTILSDLVEMIGEYDLVVDKVKGYGIPCQCGKHSLLWDNVPVGVAIRPFLTNLSA